MKTPVHLIFYVFSLVLSLLVQINVASHNDGFAFAVEESFDTRLQGNDISDDSDSMDSLFTTQTIVQGCSRSTCVFNYSLSFQIALRSEARAPPLV